jgi:hypothetical protein
MPVAESGLECGSRAAKGGEKGGSTGEREGGEGEKVGEGQGEGGTVKGQVEGQGRSEEGQGGGKALTHASGSGTEGRDTDVHTYASSNHAEQRNARSLGMFCSQRNVTS